MVGIFFWLKALTQRSSSQFLSNSLCLIFLFKDTNWSTHLYNCRFFDLHYRNDQSIIVMTIMLKVNILYIANIFSVIAKKFAFAWHLFWLFVTNLVCLLISKLYIQVIKEVIRESTTRFYKKLVIWKKTTKTNPVKK